MSIIRYSIIVLFFTFSSSFAEEVKKIGKFKDWEVIQVLDTSGKICFAQSKPVLQSPKKGDREARLFVTFRPGENIKDEVSITSGHEYKSSSVTARSGKNNFSFFSQNNFAWLLDEREEQKLIKTMKRATDLMIKANSKKGTQSTDHYSMMGFTKAYNTAKKNCS